MPISQARQEAERWSLDLIEVAPEAEPPVCRIMDYGKFRYEAQKKQKESSKKSSQTELKGIRVRPNTDDHDMAFKVKNAIRFLQQGNMVKFNVIFRGPELRHKEVGMAQLTQFIETTKDVAEVEMAPRMEGRQMTMLLRPKADAIKKAVKPAAAPQPAAAAAVEGAEEPKRGPTPKHHEPVLIPPEME
jgi:translation initiation factor IF-3